LGRHRVVGSACPPRGFSFPGIWQPTAGGNCYVFLACDPNPLVEPIQPEAMPVIVHL
jgi:hypothetical protein